MKETSWQRETRKGQYVTDAAEKAHDMQIGENAGAMQMTCKGSQTFGHGTSELRTSS